MSLCKFCDILSLSLENESNNIGESCDTIIFETNSFFVTPALGSLVPGYVMIISKKHIFSMAYLTIQEITELFELVNFLRKYLTFKLKVPTVMFEHGSAENCFEKAANSVDHAHIHIVPIHIENEDAIIGNVFRKIEFTSHDLNRFRDNPYILFMNEDSKYFLSTDTVLPRQFMRRCIAKEINCESQWNWNDYAFSENINFTVEIFNNINEFTSVNH